MGVQLREQVGVLVGRQRPPVSRHVPQRVQAGAGEAREGEATRRIDDFDQAAFQQRADRGPVRAWAGPGGGRRPSGAARCRRRAGTFARRAPGIPSGSGGARQR
ncbi:MAG: hypothetical protein MZV65_33315 [Chromatiales bacterium]|nr:hypothetical protein [Chromatiales bacterium]